MCRSQRAQTLASPPPAPGRSPCPLPSSTYGPLPPHHEALAQPHPQCPWWYSSQSAILCLADRGVGRRLCCSSVPPLHRPTRRRHVAGTPQISGGEQMDRSWRGCGRSERAGGAESARAVPGLGGRRRMPGGGGAVCGAQPGRSAGEVVRGAGAGRGRARRGAGPHLCCGAPGGGC